MVSLHHLERFIQWESYQYDRHDNLEPSFVHSCNFVGISRKAWTRYSPCETLVRLGFGVPQPRGPPVDQHYQQ